MAKYENLVTRFLKYVKIVTLSNIDIGKCLDSHYDRKRLEDEICKNRNSFK